MEYIGAVLFVIVILGAIAWVFVDSGNRIDPRTGRKLKRGEIFIIPKEEDNDEREIEIKKLNPNRFESKIAKIVRKEIEDENYEDVIWLKAFKKARGNKQEAQALYADYRTSELEKIYYTKDDVRKKYAKITSGNESFSENKFLSGQESLANAFWLYTFLGNLVVGIIIGMLSVAVGLWVTIFMLGYLIFSTIGLWKCADTYANEMQRKRKPYGWAIGAKAYAVINLLVIPGQIFLMVGVK
jgi:hypothetical protein